MESVPSILPTNLIQEREALFSFWLGSWDDKTQELPEGLSE